MVGYPNALKQWWPTLRPAHKKGLIPITFRLQGKWRRKIQWSCPKAHEHKQLITSKPRASSFFPFWKLKGNQIALKMPTVCLAHLEEESARRDENTESKDLDGIDRVTEAFMVHLVRAMKDAQMEEKCCYHCSSPEHFIQDCPFMKASRENMQLNCKEGMAPKKGAQAPQTKIMMPKDPQEEVPKV